MRRFEPWLRWWLLVGVLVSGCGGGAPPRPVDPSAFPSTADPGRPAVLWAVGDADAGEPSRRVVQRIAADRPERVLYLGDVYESGTPEEFADRFAPLFGGLARKLLPTPGNHDWPAHERGYDPYWAKVTGRPTPPWYAVQVGGWRLLSLNSEAPHEPGSAQLRWLQSALRGASGTCTLAFWHRPRFSAGPHGDDESTATLWDALRGKAALVLSGHDHDLQRLRPQDGLTQYVAGAGGRSHYAVDASDPRLAFFDDQRDGALRIRLSPGLAELTFVAADGAVLDRSAVPCRKA